MIAEETGGIGLLRWEIFRPFRRFLTTGVTTRTGGCSKEDFSSLNLGLHCGDNPERVLENRRRLSQALELEPEHWVIPEQTHGINTRIVRFEDRGRGALALETAIRDTDILLTKEASVPLMILTADCVPIVLYDPVNHAGAVAHCGWKGTAAGGIRNAVRQMIFQFHTNPADVRAGIGPAICLEHYQVSPEVEEHLYSYLPQALPARNKNHHVDLKDLNRQQLLAEGLEPEHIETAGECTYGDPATFYSYRRSPRNSGRMGTFLLLKKQTRDPVRIGKNNRGAS